MGVVSFMLALCCLIAFVGMGGAEEGHGDPPPPWLLPGLGFFVVSGVWMIRKKLPDPTEMKPAALFRFALRPFARR